MCRCIQVRYHRKVHCKVSHQGVLPCNVLDLLNLKYPKHALICCTCSYLLIYNNYTTFHYYSTATSQNHVGEALIHRWTRDSVEYIIAEYWHLVLTTYSCNIILKARWTWLLHDSEGPFNLSVTLFWRPVQLDCNIILKARSTWL